MPHLSALRWAACVLLAAFVSIAAAAAEPAATPDPERVAAAKDMMEATGVVKQMDGMVAVLGQGFRKGATDAAGASGAAKADAASQQFDRYMKRLMSYRQQMVDDFAVLYAERFTAPELKSIADFYRSPTGAKFVTAMPQLIQSGAQIGMKYSRKALEDEAGHKPEWPRPE
jgi:hypothetical protein